MKKKLLISLIVALIIIILIGMMNFLAGRIFKPKLEETLTNFLEQPVKIKQVDMNFVFGRAVIRKASIKNLSGFPSSYLLKANKIIIEGNFLPFWKKKLIILGKLVLYEPEINIDYLSQDKVNILALFSSGKDLREASGSYDKGLLKASRKGVFIKKLLIKNARINFYDYEKGAPYVTTAEKVDIGINNFTHWLWAKGLETLFIIRGKIKNEPATNFEIQGKVNYLLKSKINGCIEVEINDIHLVHFAPYYASVFKHLEVKSGLASIYARVKCDRNNLAGASKVVIKEYTLQAKDKSGGSIIRIGEAIRGKSGELELMLRLGGSLEEPTWTLSTDISEAKMRELFNRLPGLDLSSTLLEGARKATSGIGKRIGDVFGRVFLGKNK